MVNAALGVLYQPVIAVGSRAEWMELRDGGAAWIRPGARWTSWNGTGSNRLTMLPSGIADGAGSGRLQTSAYRLVVGPSTAQLFFHRRPNLVRPGRV